MKFSAGSRQRARRWTRLSTSASACFALIRNSLSRRTAGCWTWATKRRRDFSLAVRKHADSIAEKYILPDEHTFDYALMFVPSEGVFYELIMTQDTKYGALDEYCRSKRVYPVSPNTVCAIVGSIAMSLQGQKLEENARHLLANLSGLQKQLDLFAEVYGKLGTHLRNAQQNYEDADSKLSRARNSLEQMSQGALTDGEPKALEPASTE